MICGSTIWLIYKQLWEAFEEVATHRQGQPRALCTRWDVAGLLGLGRAHEPQRQAPSCLKAFGCI
jgi:hypothetical protein